jgi:hypothetical protein
MSTTFEVLPGKDYIPTFDELIELSSAYINAYLKSIGINEEVDLLVNLHKKDESYFNNEVLYDNAKWEDDSYAWFHIDGVAGGTDAYFWPFDEFDRDIWKEEIQLNPQISKYANEINICLNIGHRWSFRRSAGQPGIIVLSYGLIAAALAELTHGLIYSDDGAWDYSLFPASINDFLGWYFRPEITTHTESKQWAESCIKRIREELDMRTNEK